MHWFYCYAQVLGGLFAFSRYTVDDYKFSFPDPSKPQTSVSTVFNSLGNANSFTVTKAVQKWKKSRSEHQKNVIHEINERNDDES